MDTIGQQNDVSMGLRIHPQRRAGKPGVAELTRTLAGELERAGLTVLLEEKTAALAGLPNGRSIPDLGREADLLVVLGGGSRVAS